MRPMFCQQIWPFKCLPTFFITVNEATWSLKGKRLWASASRIDLPCSLKIIIPYLLGIIPITPGCWESEIWSCNNCNLGCIVFVVSRFPVVPVNNNYKSQLHSKPQVPFCTYSFVVLPNFYTISHNTRCQRSHHVCTKSITKISVGSSTTLAMLLIKPHSHTSLTKK